jgi:hypothetical protein
MDDSSPVSNPFDADDKAGSRTILFASLAFLGLCCCAAAVGALLWFRPNPQALIAEYFPSPTVTASVTPSATSTPRATATSTSTPTPNLTATAEIVQMTGTADAIQSTARDAAGTWRVTLTDTFDSNKNDWLNETADDEFARVNYQVVDGKYRWEVTAHKSFIGWVRASEKTFSDFSVSVDIQQVSGPDTADYGIIFREDEDGNFYYFGISDNGFYSLYEYAGEWRPLIEFTETDLLQPGQSNRITIIGVGSQFTFFINDQYLTYFTDDHIAKGSVALAIEVAEENDEAVFEFDNFELRTP